METEGAYAIKKEDIQRMAELAGIEYVEQYESKDRFNAAADDDDTIFDPEHIEPLLGDMADAAFSTTADDEQFFYFWCASSKCIREAASESSEVAEMVLLGFKFAISRGSALSMNCLGALYYMGDIVEQDYAKAAELYEMAMDAGCYQSIINLGYIYEYGRTGKPDYAKAYQFYSLAAALAPSSEAVYKLGDMFSRGKAVPRDMKKAHALYVRSLQLAENDVEAAQPAIRLAKMLIDPAGPSYGVETNPMDALKLFQRAEIGLRKDIADGQLYYRKRLVEAIEGQQTAREMLDENEGIVAVY